MRITALLTAILLAGCITPKEDKYTLQATDNIQKASVELKKAKYANERVTVQIASGKTAAAELKKTATAKQLPLVTILETALTDASRENAEITTSIAVIETKLTDTQKQVDKAQNTIADLRAKNARYQRLKLWIMIFAGAAAGYVAFKLVPPIGPDRYYVALGSSVVVATLVYTFL